MRRRLEPIRAIGAKRACLSFKERTTRPSGMHPRHPGWARDQEGLAMLLNLCEQVGAFPTSEREVLISLYRKPKGGGRRPIAGFRALYRIWGRARKSTLLAWERQHAAEGFFNTGAGRMCSDGVWRAEAHGELATGAGSHYAVLLWDLVKAFEMVDHQLLIQEADN